MTVIATGFDADKAAQQKAVGSQRPVQQAQAPRQQPVQQPAPQQQQSKTIEFPLRTFDKDDLDIPSFLRRS